MMLVIATDIIFGGNPTFSYLVHEAHEFILVHLFFQNLSASTRCECHRYIF